MSELGLNVLTIMRSYGDGEFARMMTEISPKEKYYLQHPAMAS